VGGNDSVTADGHHRPPRVVNRPSEAHSIEHFLTSMSREPAGLVLEGEPGIGKTTVWLAAIDQARSRGFRVLSTRTAAVESGLAYASLADLLREVDVAKVDALPGPQKLALEGILLRTGEHGTVTDQRAVSAAFLSIVEMLREASPVLIAIDDLQWLDPSSRHVVAFAMRRLPSGVGIVGTARTDTERETAWQAWLQLTQPDAVRRVFLEPFSLGALHLLVSQRVGRSLPRPTMARIYEVSRGNPFYAIEFALAIDTHSPVGGVRFPRTLSEVVRSRLDSVDSKLREALLALACLASATLEHLTRAIGTSLDELIELIEQAEAKGIVEIVGSRVEFTHPLLAAAIYDDAAPTQRRAMHRRLAQIVDQAELRARHLALGATQEDPTTLHTLDSAAESARVRGAPAAAAELLELAMQLGGDTPERRIRAAASHFAAGDSGRARSLLENAIARMQSGAARGAAIHTLALVRLEDDSFTEAASLITQGLNDAVGDNELRVEMLVTLSYALLNSGNFPAAVPTVDEAAAHAAELNAPHLMSLALGMQVVMRFMRGDGFDERAMSHALAQEDRDARVPMAFRAHVQNAMLLGFTGDLERAHQEMFLIRRRCLESGGESELIFVGFQTVLQAIWRGDMTEASLIAEDTMERALQLGGDFPAFIALTVRAAVAAYSGRELDARRDIEEALAAGQRSSAFALLGWTLGTLGFLEVSLGNFAAAVATLEPLIALLGAQPDATELIPAASLPDAVEALIQLGQLDRAEQLIRLIERNGSRLDRPWMLAVGARCRSMLLAAAGDLDSAASVAEQAMAQHNRVPMPFERARSQLLLGQLQLRQRHREAGTATLREALATFKQLDIPLWANRAEDSLARNDAKSSHTGVLTPSEERVAELVASGMTNRDVAAALFISVKTVEVNLTRIYRKLDIHSRAELGRRIDQLNI
jgi:DNA-binding CsgD family transcriptional regulator